MLAAVIFDAKDNAVSLETFSPRSPIVCCAVAIAPVGVAPISEPVPKVGSIFAGPKTLLI